MNNKKGSALVYVMILLAFSAIISVGALTISDHNIKMTEKEYVTEQAYLTSKSGLQFINKQFQDRFNDSGLYTVIKDLDVLNEKVESVNVSNGKNLKISLTLINTSPKTIQIDSTAINNGATYTTTSYATLDILSNLKPLNVIEGKDKIEVEIGEDFDGDDDHDDDDDGLGHIKEHGFDDDPTNPSHGTDYQKGDENKFQEDHALNTAPNTSGINSLKTKFDNEYTTRHSVCTVKPHHRNFEIKSACVSDDKKEAYVFLNPKNFSDREIEFEHDLTLTLSDAIKDNVKVVYLYTYEGDKKAKEISFESSIKVDNSSSLTNKDVPLIFLTFSELKKGGEKEELELEGEHGKFFEGWIIAPNLKVEVESDNGLSNPVIKGGIIAGELEVEAEDNDDTIRIDGVRPKFEGEKDYLGDIVNQIIDNSSSLITTSSKWRVKYEK